MGPRTRIVESTITDEERTAADQFGLPKWPAMVVHGDPVSPEQAMEILVRTNYWGSTCNDHEWDRKVLDMAGIKYETSRGYLSVDYNDVDRFSTAMGVLPLEYLANSRVSSSFVGGPHGWCDWDGRIGSSTYNIGKWPGAATVLDEWALIAKTFPFLNLWCQLYSHEVCEAEARPVVEYIVKDGRAVCQPPTQRAARPTHDDFETNLLDIVAGRAGRERGCSGAKLAQALKHVRWSLRA